MPYKLAGKVLPPDTAFTHNDIQYPANWLRLSSKEDRDNIKITWEADSTVTYDQEFYWGPSKPKDHTELKNLWTDKVNITSHQILSFSDWLASRKAETGKAIPAIWGTWRAKIRTEAATKITAIADTSDTAALATYIKGGVYSSWTADPDQGKPTDITLSGGLSDKDDGSSTPVTVGNLIAQSKGSGTHTFTLVAGTGSTNNSDFSISGNTLSYKGSAVAKDATKSLRVKAADALDQTFEKALTITVV